MKKARILILVLSIILSFIGCGQKNETVVVRCQHCGALNPESARFCSDCGEGLSEHMDKPNPGKNETPTHPTESITHPTEDVYVMQNSGADGIYYGNNVCIDGNVIYIGYYGNIYIFGSDEVAVYAGGGTKTTTIAEMYLYNGYVYYVNMDNNCVYRMCVADGKRESVLSGVGKIEDSFICEQNLFVFTLDQDSQSRIYCIDLATQKSKILLKEECDVLTHTPVDDGRKWNYYLAWGSNNLCRENKETKVQELLVRSGTGNREDGETVAKTYAIKEILYADDTQIVFKRSRMADGVEFSIWVVDSDGNNLTELLRKDYHSAAPTPYPAGAPNIAGGGTGSPQNGSAAGTQTCALCQGDGRVTCYYCKGTGKGQTIYIMGIPTEQGCSYCGSAGWRLCSGCGGRGEK